MRYEPDPPEGSLANDIGALQEAGYDTSDVGTGNTSFNAGWVGQETGVSSSEAAAAGHAARDDMEASGNMGIPPDRHNR